MTVRLQNIQSQLSMNISNVKPVIEAITCFNECVSFFQWLRSLRPRSNGAKNKEFKEDDAHILEDQEDDILKLQSSLQCLRDTLPAMYNFIDRAEWRSHDKCVAQLLPELKAAVYDAEDLLEDFRCYEQKVKIEGNATSMVPIHEFLHDFIQGNLNKLAHIKERLDNQFRILKAMGLHQATPRFDRSARPETTSFPTEAKIFGRDKEIEELIRLLSVLSNNRRGSSKPKRKRSAIRSSAGNQVCATTDNNEATIITSVPVLPMVGIGGVGKTTLAQTICSHPQVKKQFDNIVWICVSDDFDVKRLTKEAIEQFSRKAPTTDNLNSLQGDLANSLNKRRFLIVLDDMWAENRELWKTFYAPFKHVHEGSMMLVTTRSQKVADIVRTADPFLLEGLKDDALQNFFKLCVFGSDSSNNDPELRRIGEQILPKLKGSPLAAKTLGRLLGRNLDPEHWNKILYSQLWELRQEETDILPALRLSYMYLPLHLKRCFSFCAVYRKDYKFVKEDLAKIWVAEGFVEPEQNIPIQQTGCEYFEELTYLSFFQKVGRKYVIHDLMHDMAQLVSKDECFIIKEKKDLERIPHNVRHLSVLKSRYLKCSDLESPCKQTKLRTLICDMSLNSIAGNKVMEKWCTELLCMRVMVYASISEPLGLSDSISNMKNLRYLKILDSCCFMRIPETFCSLYNLERLCASKSTFREVPRGFSNLINLQKFESKSLSIDAAMGNGEGIRLIKNSILMTRDLSIRNLCEISKDQAAETELMKKDCIFSLTLVWSKQSWDMPGPAKHNEMEVFRALHPPTSIKSVHLYCYPGENLPSWFRGSDSAMLSSLTEISIHNCPRLSSLELFLQPAYMPAIKELWIENCISLETVPIERFENLHSLKKLYVVSCPKMNSRCLLAPSLEKLLLNDSGSFGDDIDCISLTTFILRNSHLASLTFIRESEAISTSTSHGSIEEKLHRLTNLTIESCFQLETLHHGIFSCLKNLSVESCPRLKWQSEIVLPSSLQDLTLKDCGDLSAWFLRCLEKLTSLISLKMDKCKHIEVIPRALWTNNLKSLHELEIRNCEDLASIGPPEGIAHIPKVWIENCPKLKEVQQPLKKGCY